MDYSTPGFLSIINSQSLLKLISIELVMPSNHLILCHPFSSHLQSFPASGSSPMSQPFASGGQSIGVSAQDENSNEYSGLFSFRRDWLDLLDVQETLKSLLQHSILRTTGRVSRHYFPFLGLGCLQAPSFSGAEISGPFWAPTVLPTSSPGSSRPWSDAREERIDGHWKQPTSARNRVRTACVILARGF